jgi:hypothetical protein
MKSAKQNTQGDILVVSIAGAKSGVGDIVIRNTKAPVDLEGRVYEKYRIMKPAGFEQEEILHRRERGHEALLGIVFTTLAEATRDRAPRKRP